MATKSKFVYHTIITKFKFFCRVMVNKPKFFCVVRRSSVFSHQSWTGWYASSKFCCFWPTTNVFLDSSFAFTDGTRKLFAVYTKQLLANNAFHNCILILHLTKLEPQWECFSLVFINKIAACAIHCMRPNKASAHFYCNVGCLHCTLCRDCCVCIYNNMRVRNNECLHFFSDITQLFLSQPYSWKYTKKNI